MSIGSLLSRVVPTAIGYATGGPVGAVTAFQATERQKNQEKYLKSRANKIATERAQLMQYGSGEFGTPGITFSGQPLTQQPIQGGFLSNIRSGVREIGGLVSDIFGTGIPQILGMPRTKTVIQQPAVTTTPPQGAQETAQSSNMAFMGGGLGQAVGAVGRFLRTPTGQIGTGLGTGLVASFMGQDGKPVRITRKMKAQYRSVLNLAGGDYALASDMIGVSQDFFIAVLLKRFRNDGPVVTKSALRKTKQTVRRLKHMCDLYDSLRPTATRRRAPMKRASTTLISNK